MYLPVHLIDNLTEEPIYTPYYLVFIADAVQCRDSEMVSDRCDVQTNSLSVRGRDKQYACAKISWAFNINGGGAHKGVSVCV